MTITKGNVGRPALPPDEKRDRFVTVRVRGVDRDLMERAAKLKGLPLSSFIGSHALEAARVEVRKWAGSEAQA